MNKKHVLLINLGTPDNATPSAVYKYLTEFLNDKRVIDLPAILRWILVNLLIVPFRYKRSAKAYQAIWTKAGSPLLQYSIELKNALAAELGSNYHVELGMRYGQPNIKNTLAELKNCQELIVLPLFPHYSSAATGSALQALMQPLSQQWNIPKLIIKKDFYAHPNFIQAYTEIINSHLQDKKIDLLLFSYHGLPERHLDKSHCHAPCDRKTQCVSIDDNNHYCYRAQCYRTSQLIADTLRLSPHDYEVAFQSRLGRTPWIKPYTDHLLPQLIKRNVQSIAVVCPSFVADCLETLEEVNIRLRQQWLSLGGKEFIFIPALNAHPVWVKALAGMITT
jgi:ferrochelatase